MTKEEKIEAVKALMTEMTCSQSLGERCAEEMGVDEENLYEITSYVIDLLDKELKK